MTEVQNVPVYIVDDDISVSDALCYVLEGYGFQVTTHSGGEEFLQASDLQKPGCLILDYRMPGLNGQQVHEHLVKSQSCIEVMFLTSHGDLSMAVTAFRDGACDFYEKPVKASDLIPAIHRAQKKSLRSHFRVQCEKQHSALTEREKQLFDLVVKGKMNKQIADILCISLRTVEVHRSKMMDRFNTHKVTDLVKISTALGHGD